MRILVVGAGAVGGYFGGRLLQAGRDVTFLVRTKRAEQLARNGLQIRSQFGDVSLAKPPTIGSESLCTAFDLIVLSCKAYDLEAAVASFAPAVGPATAVLPLLNGMQHLDVLAERFEPARVLGGLCLIAATLDETGAVVHLNDSHAMSFGELAGGLSTRVEAITGMMAGALFDAQATDQILQQMWEKWVFLASLAGSTCLMRASVGDIVQAPGGTEFMLGLLHECGRIAQGAGYAPRPAFLERIRATLTQAGSLLTASMLRDIERGARIESNQVIADLIRRAKPGSGVAGDIPLLRLVHGHLRAYEARREREGASFQAAAGRASRVD
jgi:2-dehydropantoate 2-reductase